MKTNIINTNSVMKNYMKYICAVLLVIGTSAHAWGDPISLASLNLGTPAVSEDFEDLSTCENTPGNEGGGTIQTDQTAYGVFTNTYVGKSTEIGFGIYSAADPFTSKYLKIFADGAKYTGVCFTRSFTSKGSYDITISKSSNGWFGLYAAVGNGELNNKNNNTVYFSWDGKDLKIANGDASTKDSHVWQLVSSPTTDLIRVTVVYNLSNADDTYGGITIGHGKAHVFVNGTAIMDGASPKAFTIPEERTPTYFRIYTKESAGVSADDLKIYDALPSNTFSVTYDGNGNTGGDVPTDNTDYSSGATVTVSGNSGSLVRTGYTFDGWNTLANGSGTPYAAGATFTITENATLYAQWSLNSHTLAVASVANVSINATTPSVAEGSSTSVNYGTTVTLSHGSPDGGRQWGGWNVYKTGDASTMVTVNSDNQFSMPDYNVTVSANLYTDLVFSCAELTLTAHPETAGAPIFITSVANKKVRSQGYITINGSGLTPSTTLTFPNLPDKFEILTSTGTAIATDGNGIIDNVNAYIYYTPAGDATTDGLDKITGITVSVSGGKPKQVNLLQDIIGRHLPTTGYVIAGKKDNKWYALPSNMASTSTPAPSEIAVDNLNNPTIAYTAASNIYGLEGPTTSGSGNNISTGNGQYVRLTMSISDGADENPGPAPLFGSGSADIGKSGKSHAASNLSAGWWWELKQTNTSVSNPQDAKYTIKCANNGNTLSIKNSPFVWGLYASGVEELRLIPASDIPFTEAYFVEWGQHGGIVEVDAQGIDATSVIAHLGATSSSAITLVQTKEGDAKNATSKYNYTVNFGDGIDFADAESNGALLILDWKNDETVKAKTSIVVPKIIASTATMKSLMSGDTQWETEVHVLPNVTLTANAGDFSSNDVMINHLEIYPGATVVVTKGEAASGTLKVKTLVLRNGWTRVGEKTYDVARLYITPTTASLAKNASGDVWYADWYIDFDQYYPIAVPWNVATSAISYKNTKQTAQNGVKIRYFDGSARAGVTPLPSGTSNWVEYAWTWEGDAPVYAMPATLSPGAGYAMTAKRPGGKAFSIVRMPLTIPSNDWTALGEQGEVSGTHKDQVSVTAFEKDNGSTPWYAKGWNFIGNPYMSVYQGTVGSIAYATIPDVEFRDFEQLDLSIETTKLNPASGFFVQAGTTETVTFGTANRKESKQAYRNELTAIPVQKAYIELSNETGTDMMGVLVGDDYTEDYEINADLAKILGDANTVKTYMNYSGMNLAYVAINETLAKSWIPVTVKIPTTGEYTFSLSNFSTVDALEGIYLIDHANGDKVTNLIEEDYTFSEVAGTNSERFALNAIVGERQTPTDVDATNGGTIDPDKAIKFVYREKVYILYHGEIYDLTGKKVK